MKRHLKDLALLLILVAASTRFTAEPPLPALQAENVSISGVRLGMTQSEICRARGDTLIGGRLENGQLLQQWMEGHGLGGCTSRDDRVTEAYGGELRWETHVVHAGDTESKVREALGQPDEQLEFQGERKDGWWCYDHSRIQVSWDGPRVDGFYITRDKPAFPPGGKRTPL